MKYSLLVASALTGVLALGCSAQSAPEVPAPSPEASAPQPSPEEPPPADKAPEQMVEETKVEPPASKPGPESEADQTRPARRPRPPLAKPLTAEEACAGGGILDDGVADTGYGFVPQSKEGVYVQRFERDQLPGAEIEAVCACFIKSKFVNNIEFEVVFFKEVNGVPAAEPYAAFPAIAREVPKKVSEARTFYRVDVSGVRLPEGASYIGVQWDPNRFKFSFVCTDTDEPDERGEPVPVFFRDDVKTRWQSVFQSRDPIFTHHYSILVRALAAKSAAPSAESEKN